MRKSILCRISTNSRQVPPQTKPQSNLPINDYLAESGQQDSMLLDSLNAEKIEPFNFPFQKDDQKSQCDPNPVQTHQRRSDHETRNFYETAISFNSEKTSKSNEEDSASQESKTPNKSESPTEYEGEIEVNWNQSDSKNCSQFKKEPKNFLIQIEYLPISTNSYNLNQPKDSRETNFEQSSHLNTTFGIYSPSSRNIKNVPMTKSIIDIGSPNRNKNIFIPPSRYQNSNTNKQEIIQKLPQNQPLQFKKSEILNEDLQSKRQITDQMFRFSEPDNIDQNDFDPKQSEEKSENSPQEFDAVSQNQSPIIKKGSNIESPEGKGKKLFGQEECPVKREQDRNRLKDYSGTYDESIRNSNPPTRMKRSKSHDQLDRSFSKTKTKTAQYKGILPGKKTSQTSIIDGLNYDQLSQNTNSPIKVQNQDLRQRIFVKNPYSENLLTFKEPYEEKENQGNAGNIISHDQIRQENIEEKTTTEPNPFKNQSTMNRSIDFKSVKPRSRFAKNTISASKNNSKNIELLISQKAKRDFENFEHISEEKYIGKIATTFDSFARIKDAVLKLVQEEESENLQQLINQMNSQMEGIEEATNISRLQRKMMSKNLNKAKKHISSLKDSNRIYESLLKDLSEKKQQETSRNEQIFMNEFNQIGALIQNGRIIISKEKAEQFTELRRKLEKISQNPRQKQHLREAELASLNSDPEDYCKLLLKDVPKNNELFEIMSERSDDENEMGLKLHDYINSLVISYISVCLACYPNTLNERLQLLRIKEQEILKFFDKKGILLDPQLLSITEKFLENIQLMAQENRK